jgi:hypothetical protein
VVDTFRLPKTGFLRSKLTPSASLCRVCQQLQNRTPSSLLTPHRQGEERPQRGRFGYGGNRRPRSPKWRGSGPQAQ